MYITEHKGDTGICTGFVRKDNEPSTTVSGPKLGGVSAVTASTPDRSAGRGSYELEQPEPETR